jgi:mono/diheme cytochrome c family protein
MKKAIMSRLLVCLAVSGAALLLLGSLAEAGTYATKCAMCHGKDGKGSKMCEKDISGADAATLAKVLAGAGKPKAHKADLSEADIAAVAAEIKGLSGGGPGAELFAKNCAMCHGKDGKGSKMCEKDISGLDEDAIVKALVGDAKAESHKKPVEEAEAKEIAAFLTASAPKSCSAAGADLYAKNCAMCHGKDGKGSKMCEKSIAGLDSDAVVKALVGDAKTKSHKKEICPAMAKDIAAYVKGL